MVQRRAHIARKSVWGNAMLLPSALVTIPSRPLRAFRRSNLANSGDVPIGTVNVGERASLRATPPPLRLPSDPEGNP